MSRRAVPYVVGLVVGAAVMWLFLREREGRSQDYPTSIDIRRPAECGPNSLAEDHLVVTGAEDDEADVFDRPQPAQSRPWKIILRGERKIVLIAHPAPGGGK
jgi:hypothetical protein